MADPAARLIARADGHGRVKGFYEALFAALGAGGNPPVLTPPEVIASGDTAALRFTMSGLHSGAFRGVAATNRPYTIGGIMMLRFAGERVIERRSCADVLGLLVQIGAAPPPGEYGPARRRVPWRTDFEYHQATTLPADCAQLELLRQLTAWLSLMDAGASVLPAPPMPPMLCMLLRAAQRALAIIGHRM